MQTIAYSYNEAIHSDEKEWTAKMYNYKDESEKVYAEQKMAGTKKDILYNFIFMKL